MRARTICVSYSDDRLFQLASFFFDQVFSFALLYCAKLNPFAAQIGFQMVNYVFAFRGTCVGMCDMRTVSEQYGNVFDWRRESICFILISNQIAEAVRCAP